MLENNLEQMYSSGLEMYTGVKPVNLPSNIGGPIGEPAPLRCPSSAQLGDSLPNAFGMSPEPSGFNLLKDKKGKTYGIGRNLYIEEAKKELMERFRKPEEGKTHGFHINYETIIPGIKKPLSNTHIPLNDYLKNILKNP